MHCLYRECLQQAMCKGTERWLFDNLPVCRAVLRCACSWRPLQTSRTQRLPSSSSTRQPTRHEQQPCCAQATMQRCLPMLQKGLPVCVQPMRRTRPLCLGFGIQQHVCCAGTARVDSVVCPLGDWWRHMGVELGSAGGCRQSYLSLNSIPGQPNVQPALSCTVQAAGGFHNWCVCVCVCVRPQTIVFESRTAASLNPLAGQQPAHLVLPYQRAVSLACVLWRRELRGVLVWAGGELATSACKSSAV